jgi:hypothetical protein
MSRELDVFLHFLFLGSALLCWQLCSVRKDFRYLRYVGLYLYITFLFDGVASTIMLNSYLAKVFVSNLFLYHILVPIQFYLIANIFTSVIESKRIRRISKGLVYPFVAISILVSFTIQPVDEYNSYATLIKHLITIVLVLVYFYEIITVTPFTKIYLQPIFWVSVGLLFHSTINVLLEGFSNYFHTYSNSHYHLIYFLYSISNYCLFLLISIGLLAWNLKKN